MEAPILSGVETVGRALTTSNGGWTFSNGSPASPNYFAYTWWRDSSIISGASAKSYTLTSADVGHNIHAHVVAAIGTPCSGPSGAADSNTILFRNIAVGDYTYDQAKTLGLDVQPTPAEWGLPQCPDDQSFDGFGTEDAAEAAATAAPDEPACATDPSDSTVTVGAPVMHGSENGVPGAYHYAGWETTGTWRGGRFTVEVTNPFVDHNNCRTVGCDEHVASRLVAKSKYATSFRDGPFLEIGWVEVSFLPDQRRVFTGVVSRSRTFAPIFHSPTRYPLLDGRFYLFKLRTCTNGTALCAYVLWRRNGVLAWEPLRANPDLSCASGTLCRNEYFLEVYSEQEASPHPGLNDGERIRFRSLRIRNSSGFVPPPDLTSVQTPPYLVCNAVGSTDPTAFDARRVASC